MNLVADASAILRHLLSRRAAELLAHPSVDLLMTEDAFAEAARGLDRRLAAMVGQGRLTTNAAGRLEKRGRAVLATLPVIERAAYVAEEERARERLETHCRDDDWPSIALAIVMGEAAAGIWSDDRDYFGSGIAVWSSPVLLRVLNI